LIPDLLLFENACRNLVDGCFLLVNYGVKCKEIGERREMVDKDFNFIVPTNPKYELGFETCIDNIKSGDFYIAKNKIYEALDNKDYDEEHLYNLQQYYKVKTREFDMLSTNPMNFLLPVLLAVMIPVTMLLFSTYNLIIQMIMMAIFMVLCMTSVIELARNLYSRKEYYEFCYQIISEYIKSKCKTV